ARSMPAHSAQPAGQHLRSANPLHQGAKPGAGTKPSAQRRQGKISSRLLHRSGNTLSRQPSPRACFTARSTAMLKALLQSDQRCRPYFFSIPSVVAGPINHASGRKSEPLDRHRFLPAFIANELSVNAGVTNISGYYALRDMTIKHSSRVVQDALERRVVRLDNRFRVISSLHGSPDYNGVVTAEHIHDPPIPAASAEKVELLGVGLFHEHEMAALCDDVVVVH